MGPDGLGLAQEAFVDFLGLLARGLKAGRTGDHPAADTKDQQQATNDDDELLNVLLYEVDDTVVGHSNSLALNCLRSFAGYLVAAGRP